MVVRIQFLNIVKVRIWDTWFPISNKVFLAIGKQYADITTAYSQGDAYRVFRIDQQSSCNGSIVTTINLFLIFWINRCDCLYYMEVITYTLKSSTYGGVCQGNRSCLTHIDLGSNSWPVSTTNSNSP